MDNFGYDDYDELDYDYGDDDIFNSPPLHTQESSSNLPRSPWNSSQAFATDTSSNPPSLTPGVLAENPAFYRRLPPLTGFILGSPSTSASQAREVPRPPRLAHPRQPSPPTRNTPDTYGGSNSIFDDLINLSGASSPRIASNTRDSSVVDLTESSPPTMAPTTLKRKASHSESQPSIKRGREEAATDSSPAQLKPRLPSSDVEEIDLVDVDDDEAYSNYQSQSQAEALKLQRQEEADKPIKLSDFQCIICLDNPTDLTVTFCGMYAKTILPF